MVVSVAFMWEDMTFFHFVLLHLRPVVVEELTDPEFIEALKLASGRTNTVHQDVVAPGL